MPARLPLSSARKRIPAPSVLLEMVRKSRVPAGGWTQQAFQTAAGARLTQDLIMAQRAAVGRGMRVLAPKLARFFRTQAEQILERFARKYSNRTGAATKAAYSVNLAPGPHQSLWAAAIGEVLQEMGLEFESIMTGAIQSTADTAFRNSAALLGGVGQTASPQPRVNQRVRRLAARVTQITETTRERLNRELARAIEKDGLTVAETVKRMRERFPQISAGRIPTIVRTEMGQAADEGRKEALKSNGTVRTVSVIGCEAREPGSPTYRGESTCNIKDVPITDIDMLIFHINHTGTIVASSFIEAPRANTPGNQPAPMQPSPEAPEEAIPGPQDIDPFDARASEEDYRRRFRSSGITFNPKSGASYLESVRLARETLGVMPDTAAARMFAPVAGSPRSTMSVSMQSSGSALLEFNGTECSCSRYIKPATDIFPKRALHELMSVTNPQSGLGRRMMKAQVDFYRETGVEMIRLHAGLSVGGYAWARFGFTPDFDDLSRKLPPVLRTRAADIKALLEEADAWRLLTATERGLLEELMAGEPVTKDMFRLLAALRGNGARAAIMRLGGILRENRNTRSLGALLLAGTDWSGSLDLTDPEAMGILSAYIE